MINREEIKIDDELLYTPGGIEVKVIEIDSYFIGVETEEGELIQVTEDELELYERVSC